MKIIGRKLSSPEIFLEKLKNILEKINQFLILFLNYNFTDFFNVIDNFLFIDGFDL